MNHKNRAIPTISFDTWALGRYARNHGVHVYARALLAHFREIAPEYSVEVSPFVSSGIDNEANTFPAAPGFHPRETRLLKYNRLWRYGGGWLAACFEKPDVLFCPTSNVLHFDSPFAAVSTIHDAIPFRWPDFGPPGIVRKLRFFLQWSARFSHAVITVSKCSQRDLMSVCGLPESRVLVVYNGYDKTQFNATAPSPELQVNLLLKHGIEKPYIFHHGQIQSRKNLKRLVQAFRLLLSRNRNLDLDLVLTGALGWGSKEVLAAANDAPEFRGKVVFTGPLSDPEVATLIKGASLVVMPSLYEGFCLPLVESMACGTPTIAANSSCLPEISGGVLRYFDPQSLEDMAACMEETLEDDNVRNTLSEKGLARANEYDWGRCAQETLAILIKIAGESRES